MPTPRLSPLATVCLALRPEPGEAILVVWGAGLGPMSLLFSFFGGLALCGGFGSGSISLCGPSLAPDDLACTLLLLPVSAVLWGFAALEAVFGTVPGPTVVLLGLAGAALAGAFGGGAIAWWIRRH